MGDWIPMEQRMKKQNGKKRNKKKWNGVLLKKERSLNHFFIIFLAHALLSFILIALLWIVLLSAASSFHILIPANTVERSVSSWLATLDGHSSITPEEIPSGAEYAFFNTDNMLLQTTLEENALETAVEFAASNDLTSIRRNSTYIYLRIDTDTQHVIIAYRLMATFASSFLRRIFPNAEIVFLLLLLFMLAADFIFIAIRYARKLNAELQKLDSAARQIGAQNLDFDVEKTKLSEFNRIMDSLEHLKTDLQHSLKEQWFLEQRKKQQLTALAHDIKTPLAIITGNAELLSETKQTKEQEEYTAFILKHTAQIHRYVTGMIAISRTAADKDSVCDIRDLLTVTVQNIEILGNRKQLSCSLSVEDLPDPLSVPKDNLQRILDNIIDNAVQYSPGNGTIFLCVRFAAHMLQIRVRDEGEGFTGEALALATTEFYRAEKSRSSKEHFGLGLTIAKQIVTELGGTLCLANAPEGGALVTICIPPCVR